jgi:hypothetical protein
MKNTMMLAAVFVAATAGSASAGGKEGSIGVGAEFGLNGLTGGLSVNYDAGKFHLGGFLGVFDGGGQNDTNYTAGGRFFYHVGSTAMSDFGIGGTVGLFSLDGQGPMNDERDTLMFLEPSFQIRLFLASNVALSFTAGIVIGVVDADGFALGSGGVGLNLGAGGLGSAGGLVTGIAGVHYYFD